MNEAHSLQSPVISAILTEGEQRNSRKSAQFALDKSGATPILVYMSKANEIDQVRTLEKLLVGLLDGIDAYESETGMLGPYWNPQHVKAARSYLAALPDGGAAAGYWLAQAPQTDSH